MTRHLLEVMDAGRAAEVRRDVICDGVYGPSLIDCVLDLLLDGISGAVCLIPGERWSEAEFAVALATVVGHSRDLIVEVGEAASALPPAVISYLPPTETMLERFVRDHRTVQG